MTRKGAASRHPAGAARSDDELGRRGVGRPRGPGNKPYDKRHGRNRDAGGMTPVRRSDQERRTRAGAIGDRALGRRRGAPAAIHCALGRQRGAMRRICRRLRHHREGSGQRQGHDNDKDSAHTAGSLAMLPASGQSTGDSTVSRPHSSRSTQGDSAARCVSESGLRAQSRKPSTATGTPRLARAAPRSRRAFS